MRPIRAVRPVSRGVAVALVLAIAACGTAGPDGAVTPVFDARTVRPEYLGPGRDDAPPDGLREILVAHFGPGDPDHPDWGDAWRGAQLAADRVNAAGGCGGLPLRLVPAWSDNPWGSGTADLAKLVLEGEAGDREPAGADGGIPESEAMPSRRGHPAPTPGSPTPVRVGDRSLQRRPATPGRDAREVAERDPGSSPVPQSTLIPVFDDAPVVSRGRVQAIVGGMDGTTTHLAEQIVAKARIALVGPGGTDPGVNLTNVAWMFTLPATDDRIAPVIVDGLLRGGAGEPWVVVTTTDRDSRASWRAVARELASRKARAPALHLTIPPGVSDAARPAAEAVGTGARVALVLASARDTGAVVRALRAAGFDGRIVGGASAGRQPFAVAAGDSAEGVEFPLLFDPDRPEAATFVSAFEARWGTVPDFLAAHSYDATSLVAEAVRRAGPNRARIRDALATLAPWPGVTGVVSWDATGRNTAPVIAGVWRSGRAVRRDGDGPAR